MQSKEQYPINYGESSINSPGPSPIRPGILKIDDEGHGLTALHNILRTHQGNPKVLIIKVVFQIGYNVYTSQLALYIDLVVQKRGDLLAEVLDDGIGATLDLQTLGDGVQLDIGVD